MLYEEYERRRIMLQDQFDKGMDELNERYTQENAVFKVGDFIGNVTGIIKIEFISHNDYPSFNSAPDIVYIGWRYKKRYGKLVKTKHKEMGRLYSYGNPQKIENAKPVHLL